MNGRAAGESDMNAAAVRVRALEAIGEREMRGLCDVLVDCVDGGASVSFMHPMTRTKAESFWNSVAASLARRERLVLIAEDWVGICGTVQVVLNLPENQP